MQNVVKYGTPWVACVTFVYDATRSDVRFQEQANIYLDDDYNENSHRRAERRCHVELFFCASAAQIGSLDAGVIH